MMMHTTTESAMARFIDTLPDDEWTHVLTWLIPHLLPEHQCFVVDRIAKRASQETYEDAAQEFAKWLSKLGLKIVPSIKWPEGK